MKTKVLLAMLTKYVQMDFQNGLDKFQKWKLQLAQTFAMA